MPRRKIRVEGNNFFLEVDLIENSLILIKNKKKTTLNFSLNRNSTYSLQHDDVLIKKGRNTCSLSEGLKILKLINTIKRRGKFEKNTLYNLCKSWIKRFKK